MNWRLASRLSVVTLATLVVLIVALWSTRLHTSGTASGETVPQSNTKTSGLQGADLGNTPAPNFQLTDQFGKSISLSQFRGKPVILTFLYTHCPDACPLTAEKLHAAMQSLGSEAQQVGVLAVSTDPKGDTKAAVLAFSQAHRMENYWHFLMGTHDELSPVWSKYSVYAAPQTSGTGVNHSTAVFVIDKQGRERAFFGDNLTSDHLVTDLQILLKE